MEPVQVLAVSKISFDWVPQRSEARSPQTPEQLVEVPTEPGYALALLPLKPWGGGEHGRWPISSLLQCLRVGREVVEVFMILVQDRVLQLRL